MRACLLNLCIFTLLQSRYVLSGDLWLPNLSKLSSIIYSCQDGLKPGPLKPLLLSLDNESISDKLVELKSSARSEGDGSAQSSANIIIRNGDRVLTISNNVNLGPGKKGLSRQATSGKSDKSSIESSVSFNLGDALTDNNPFSLLQKIFGRSITKVNGKIQPRSGPGKKDNPISISIGNNNANNQIIQGDRKQPAATAVLSVEPVGIKPQPRTPWGFGINISGGVSKRWPRAPPSDQSLAKDLMYRHIAKCVKNKLVEEYQQNSAN